MPVLFDRPTFFTYARRAPFGNRLSQEQVDGLESIISHFERTFPTHDIRCLAYVLATVFHETGGRMVPLREGFAKTDAGARKIVAKYKYGKPDATSSGNPVGKPTGHVYYGRGHVQLTWKDNYARMGHLLGIDLVNKPDLALDPAISVRILFEGMFSAISGKGDFTGKTVEAYFNETTDDPVGARRVINGKDKAQLIAGYHQHFLDSLRAARDAQNEGAEPPDVSEATGTPDGANLLTDKATVGALTTGAGGFAASIIAAVNNPYAMIASLAVLAIIGVGLYLFLTGRIEIKKTAGA